MKDLEFKLDKSNKLLIVKVELNPLPALPSRLIKNQKVTINTSDVIREASKKGYNILEVVKPAVATNLSKTRLKAEWRFKLKVEQKVVDKPKRSSVRSTAASKQLAGSKLE